MLTAMGVTEMVSNGIDSDWSQPKGRHKEEEGGLSDDKIEQIAAKRDISLDKMQKSYGLAQDAAKQWARDIE
jgi:uncharacterized protein YjbJ (UPF0337 family)